MSNSVAKKNDDLLESVNDEVTEQFDLTEDSTKSTPSLSVVQNEMTSFDIENVLNSETNDFFQAPDSSEPSLDEKPGELDFQINELEEDMPSDEASLDEDMSSDEVLSEEVNVEDDFTPPGLDVDDIPSMVDEEEDESSEKNYALPNIPSEATVIRETIKQNILKPEVMSHSDSSQINVEITGLNQLDKLEKLSALNKIDELDDKLEALHNLNKLLQMHGELFEQLSNLHKLDRLNSLKKLDRLEDLQKLDSMKELENLKQLDSLKSLERISEIEKLENLTQLQALDQLQNLSHLDRLEHLKRLDELDQIRGLDKLNNLDQLTKLENAGFFEKLDKLDRLSIMSKKFHILFLGQCFSFFLDIIKFGVACVFMFYLLSSNAGQKFTAKALTAIGFGAPAQTNFGLMLLQNEIEQPKFEDIISNVRNKIKYDYQRAFSIDNTLTMAERVNLIKDAMDYDFVYNTTNIKEETLASLRQQVIYSKANIIPKIEYDLAMAKNMGSEEDIKLLTELKVFFINKNYTQIVQKYQNSKSNLESVRLATIVATLELYIEDPETLRQLIAL